MFQWGIVMLSSALVGGSTAAERQPKLPPSNQSQEEFFENEVRPVLVERCSKCHGSNKQEGGLRIDSRRYLLEGGGTAAAIVPGDVARSLLLQAVRHDGELQMPPEQRLPAHEIHALERWVRAGAVWPAGLTTSSQSESDAAQDHWAFRPVQLPAVPFSEAGDLVRTPVDAFVLRRLNAQQLAAAPTADRRTLIRRLTYALTGLPPTTEEVGRFVADTAANAYEKVVERLLQSPHYGEHWARRWLDVARYSDTKGYVYAREERYWTHAWTYRDWVVRALNADMPFDRFLLLQLAADQVSDRSPDDLAAMGFLTLGRRFLGVKREVIDDRIDVVCRGMLGLTVSCARCHDHKYDPIPTADYYSLYGVFDSCLEKQTILATTMGDAEFRAELAKRQTTLDDKLAELADESSRRARERVADYLFSQSELHKFPAGGFDQIFQKTDLLPAFVRKWERYLRTAELEQDPIFRVWHSYAARGSTLVDRPLEPAGTGVNSLIAAAFRTPPQSFRELCDRYAEVFRAIDDRWQAELERAAKAELPKPTSLDDPDAEALREVLYGENSPCRVPDGPISHTEMFFDTDSVTQLWKLQGELDRWLINAPVEVPVALTLVDQATPVEPRVFLRGDPLRLGADVPRRFLEILGGRARGPFQRGSGRWELARAIVDPRNPLTARVLVNRVWAQYFGTGLVKTPSDFGLRAEPPSHPQLLDWLASRFVQQGWSLKTLHRWIVLSSTYRQSSFPEDGEMVQRRLRVDPDNRLLWRMNPRRLTFEEMRDSLLRVTGTLDERIGGKPGQLFTQPYPTRRTLYGLVDRQYFPSVLRVFDFANPDLHVPQRAETTVPQQALFFMNHPLVLQHARALAGRVAGAGDPRSAVSDLFQVVYQRAPDAAELREALALIDGVGDRPRSRPSGAESPQGAGQLDAWTQLAQVLLCGNEFVFVD